MGGSASAEDALNQTGDYTLRVQTDASVVNTTADVVAADGFTSLREAVNAANSVVGTDFISFDPAVFSTPQTIALNGELPLTDNIFITGPGANLLTIDAQDNSRVFNVSDGLGSNRLVVLQDMRLTGGSATNGGAIFNDEDLRLHGLAIEDNRASSQGGGIFNQRLLQVSNSTIADNTSARGGGIHQSTTSSSTQVFQSTISGNTATTGGGIDAFRGDVSVSNSTISNNSGGGVFGFGNYSYTETRLKSTIVSGNQGGDVVRHGNYQVTIHSDGYNLVGTGTAAFRFNQTGDIVGANPRLGPLEDNGGPTRTHALRFGSAAIDAGDPNISSDITDDQRGDGFSRVIGDQVDIGAFETTATRELTVDAVGDTDDGDVSPGHLTLREAMRLAHELDGEDTIVFDETVFSSPQTINLTRTLPTVTDALTIEGPGADRLTIDGQSSHLIMLIDSNAAELQTVSISGLTLANGIGFYGGAINSNEDLTITGVVLRDNVASANGGAISAGGPVTIIDSVVSGNAGRGGGGISANTLNIVDSTFSDNVASANGGALRTSTLTVDGSTFVDNRATGVGGAMFIRDGSTEITNSTLSGNEAATGGALYLFGGFGGLTISNSTVTDNAATSAGGGISKGSLASRLTIESTIVSGNNLNGSANNLAGRGFSGTFNLLGSGVTSFGSNNIISDNPLLGPLANNGGATLTHALLEGSPALNMGDPAVSGGNDQTGANRIVGGIVDIGAVESNPPVVRVLGTISEGASTEPAYDLREEEVAFYRFELDTDVVAANNQSLTIDTLGTNLDGSNDTMLGLFDSAGSRIAINDDFLGGGRLSQLSFGAGGGDGNLTAGTYYLAISGFLTSFGDSNFEANSTSSDNGSLVVNFDLTVPTGVDGDFNDDGVYDCEDIDALTTNVAGGTNDLAFDLDGDGMLSTADVSAWLAEAGAINNASGGAYLPGDANLDGIVDISDFNVWNANKFSTGSWCSGDFNASGVVDISDFNVWNANKFTTSDSVEQAALPGPADRFETHDAERRDSSSRVADAVFRDWV